MNNRYSIVEEEKTNLISLAILFHFLCTQHVSYINISIIRSLRLFCWITTLVVLFLVRYVLEVRCGWVGVVSVLQASACNKDTTPTHPHQISSTHRTKKNTTNVVIQQNSRKLLIMDILMSETCWAHKKWNKINKWHQLVYLYSTITILHGPINIRFYLFVAPTNNFNFTLNVCFGTALLTLAQFVWPNTKQWIVSRSHFNNKHVTNICNRTGDGSGN